LTIIIQQILQPIAVNTVHVSSSVFLQTRDLQTSKAPLKSQAQGTSLFMSTASNQRGYPKDHRLIKKIVRGRLRSGFQRVRSRGLYENI